MWKIVLALAAAVAVGSGLGLVGGLRDATSEYESDEGAQNALNFSVVQHNRGTNDAYLRQVAEVLKVQKQVVSGMKYIITVKMARTTCRKGSANEVCSIHENSEMAQPYQCTFTVWSRPWMQEIELLKEEC